MVTLLVSNNEPKVTHTLYEQKQMTINQHEICEALNAKFLVEHNVHHTQVSRT